MRPFDNDPLDDVILWLVFMPLGAVMAGLYFLVALAVLPVVLPVVAIRSVVRWRAR